MSGRTESSLSWLREKRASDRAGQHLETQAQQCATWPLRRLNGGTLRLKAADACICQPPDGVAREMHFGQTTTVVDTTSQILSWEFSGHSLDCGAVVIPKWERERARGRNCNAALFKFECRIPSSYLDVDNMTQDFSPRRRQDSAVMQFLTAQLLPVQQFFQVMSKQPSIIIIARHGARLDQANDTWQDSAIRPYDPPLSYGGWIQCQMLGARIRGELCSLDKSATRNDTEPPYKKRKVIIHSSPYLRCLQTSIAIGAGLQEIQPVSKPLLPPTSAPNLALSDTTRTQERSETTDQSKPYLPPSERTVRPPQLGQSQLRVDACLGEWLSPAYFERSIAPSSSEELVAEAKILFERPAEEIKGAELSMPGTPELGCLDWASREVETSSTPIHEKTGLRAMAAAGHAMSKRPRRSFAAEKPNGTDHNTLGEQINAYSPPIPNYSIAPRDEIPIGFVAHARDACIEFDIDWDSMKEPLDWGDGGPFGEEWGSMHRRFRNGLQKMLNFYETSYSHSEDEDLVLVLVTHQAGCNALIRLLTGAPALHDVGTASLSMAVRREQPLERRISESRSPLARRGSLDLGVADEFEVKIVASTEHLRGGMNPLGLNSPRLRMSPALASRRMVGGDSPEGFSIGDPMARSNSGHASSLGRSSSLISRATDEIPEIQAGLWRRESVNSEVVDENPTASTAVDQLWGSGSENRLGPTLPVRSASQRGMWGGESAFRRDRSPGKRRWTAVDRSP